MVQGSATSPAATGIGRRGPLSEAEIVAVTLDLIRARGIERFTMRRLSDRLGVALGATYKHVGTKEDLLRLVSREIYARIEREVRLRPAARTDDCFDVVRSLLVLFRDIVTGYPGMAGYMSAHLADPEPTSLRRIMTEALVAAGFSPASIPRILRVLFFYVSGAMLSAFRAGPHASVEFADGLDLVLDGVRVLLARDTAAGPE